MYLILQRINAPGWQTDGECTLSEEKGRDVAIGVGMEVERKQKFLSYLSVGMKRQNDQGNLIRKTVNWKSCDPRELEFMIAMEKSWQLVWC